MTQNIAPIELSVATDDWNFETQFQRLGLNSEISLSLKQSLSSYLEKQIRSSHFSLIPLTDILNSLHAALSQHCSYLLLSRQHLSIALTDYTAALSSVALFSQSDIVAILVRAVGNQLKFLTPSQMSISKAWRQTLNEYTLLNETSGLTDRGDSVCAAFQLSFAPPPPSLVTVPLPQSHVELLNSFHFSFNPPFPFSLVFSSHSMHSYTALFSFNTSLHIIDNLLRSTWIVNTKQKRASPFVAPKREQTQIRGVESTPLELLVHLNRISFSLFGQTRSVFHLLMTFFSQSITQSAYSLFTSTLSRIGAGTIPFTLRNTSALHSAIMNEITLFLCFGRGSPSQTTSTLLQSIVSFAQWMDIQMDSIEPELQQERRRLHKQHPHLSDDDCDELAQKSVLNSKILYIRGMQRQFSINVRNFCTEMMKMVEIHADWLDISESAQDLDHNSRKDMKKLRSQNIEHLRYLISSLVDYGA